MTKDQSKRFYDKLFKLKVKAFILVPLLATLLGVWLHGLFKVFKMEAWSFVYFNCFMLLKSVQFYMITDGTRIKLEIIYEDLMNLLEPDKEIVAIDVKSVRARMNKIRIDYLCIKDLTISYNVITIVAHGLYCV